MAAVTINLDADVEARVSRYADGVGIPLEDLLERAVIFALTTVYPDNDLPDGPFDPEVDNELPEGEIPSEPDQSLPEEGAGTKPGSERPDFNPNPNPDVDVDKDGPRPDAGLPPAPEPKY